MREGDVADLRRIGRHVSGRSVGVVFGGGGARGLAHIGVLRALAELDIPVDSVGGSSMGAIIGGQHAMGWSWERIYEHNRQAWGEHRVRFEISLPTVSLFSGRRSKRMYDAAFGELDIEDFQPAVLLHQRRPERVPPRHPSRGIGSAVDLRQRQRARVVASRWWTPSGICTSTVVS